jgi:hypothetical protein
MRSRSFRYSALATLLAAAAAACAGDRDTLASTAGLVTVFDSTSDTVRATVAGAVPAERIRQLVPDLRIASERNDTVVFGNTGEFVVAPSGRVLMHDPTGPQLLLFSPDGALAATVGRSGGGPGEYRDVNGLTALGDSLFVLYDASSSRISFFRPDGSFATSWPLPATNMIGQSMLVTDRTGQIRLSQFVIPAGGSVFDARAAWATIVPGGSRLGDSVLAPTLGVKQAEYRAENSTAGGRSATVTTGRLSPGEFTAWHPDGHYVLIEGGGYRVLFARRSGKPLVVHRDAPSIPVPDDERAWHEERTLFIMRRTNPAWSWQGPAIPHSRPAATGMFVARGGNVWVRVALPSEPIPQPERAAPRAGALPPARWRERGEYEVFAPDGRFLGRVAVPPRTFVQAADGDAVWATQTGEDDLPALVRFRVTPGWR